MIRKRITPNQTEEVTVNNEINPIEKLLNTPENTEIENTDKQPATIKEEKKPVARTIKNPVITSEATKTENSEISLSEAQELVEEIISDGDKKPKEEKNKKKKKVKSKAKEEAKEKKKKKSKKEKKKAKAKKEKAKKEKSKDKSKKKKLKAIEKNAKIKKKAMQKLRKLLTKKSKK